MKEPNTHPPRLFLRFFRWYCHPKMADYIEGDLMEVYERRLEKSGKRKADFRFMIDVLLLFRPGIIRPTQGYRNLNTYSMYKSYFKIGCRNILKRKSYSLINIGGLTLGIACAIVVFSFVKYHLSFDNFHENSDRIYRFVTESHRDQVGYEPSVPPAFAKAFRRDYTFGESVARICTLTEQLITIEEGNQLKKFKDEISFTEPEFFDIFNFPLISGNRHDLMVEPNTAVVSERIAKKYFENESPIGKIIRFNNRIDVVITGVLKEIPENTHLRSEIYFSYSTMPQYNPWYDADDAWGGITSDIQSFVLLQPGITPEEVEAVLQEYVKKYRAESKNVHHYKLQPLDDVHYNSKYGGRISKTVIWALSLTGVFLILTACVNFINLATAQAINRSREVGVRKTLGGARAQLFWQFTIETGLIVILATFFALGISYSLIPYVNELFATRVTIDLFSNFQLPVFLSLLVLTVTVLSGFYPGIVLSGFKPVPALKGKPSVNAGYFNLRRVLITTQFTISQILLFGLIVVVYQMRYFKQSDLGFNQDAIVMIPTASHDVRMNTLKSQFLQIPEVRNVSLCFAAPASEDHSWGTMFTYDNKSESEEFSISFRGADEHYLSTFNIGVIEGRNLMPSDTAREFLVNEKFVHKLGLSSVEEILGKTISILGGSVKGPVVGVVNDFHDQSFRSVINPVFITTYSNYYNSYAVKIDMANAKETLAALDKAWSGLYPDQIFEYNFLDDQIATFYRTEETMLKLVKVFSSIALFIGCMGLFGLVSFMAATKTKEIGIRKVLGGSIPHILWIFGSEFSRLVLIAFFIAAPTGWWLMSQWLETYAYRIDMAWWIFALEIFVIFAIVLVTVGYQSIKAALMNPVKSLRSE